MKKVVKKPKKITKKKLLSMARTKKRKALSEWSKQVRERDSKCIVCDCVTNLNAHHVLPKESYKELMYEVINGVTLCPGHHKFGKYSAHKNPVFFSEFLRTHRPEQWAWAIENVGSPLQ